MRKYVICSFCMILVLTGAYIYSYEKLSQPSSEMAKDDDGTTVPVSFREDTVKSSARLIIESCTTTGDSADSAQISRKETAMPATYLGLTRNKVMEKLEEYMKNLSISDLEEGLIGYDLMYFSPECLILRKTYQPDEDFHKYYIKLTRGCITVFYSDRKTVYEYTDIDFSQLPADVAAGVISGMEVKDEKELFDFLENYSS